MPEWSWRSFDLFAGSSVVSPAAKASERLRSWLRRPSTTALRMCGWSSRPERHVVASGTGVLLLPDVALGAGVLARRGECLRGASAVDERRDNDSSCVRREVHGLVGGPEQVARWSPPLDHGGGSSGELRELDGDAQSERDPRD